MPLAPASVCIILDQTRSHILLVKRKDVPIWVLPGGGIDANETPEQAAIREAYEETNCQITIDRQSGEYTPINKLAALTFVYICHIKEGLPQLCSETSAISFFSLRHLPSDFFSLHQEWLDDALIHSHVVKKQLTQVTYWAVFKYLLKHPLHLLRYLFSRLFK